MAIRFTLNPLTWGAVDKTVLRERVDELVPAAGMFTVRDLYGRPQLPEPPAAFGPAAFPRPDVLVLTTEDADYLIDTQGSNTAFAVARISDDY